jgi:hypothetical protein
VGEPTLDSPATPQTLAGATRGSALLADVMYAGDPLGVMYVVGVFTFSAD